MVAYISQLNRELALDRIAELPPKTLNQRLSDWYGSLPAVSRNRPFSMSEIEAALKTQGRYLGEGLLSIGWQRKRVWSTQGSYHRYWMPPQ